MKKFPALFIGHGSPMNVIADNSFTKSLQQIGINLPKPKAIVVVSAHWLTEGTFAATSNTPETIYDFSGFPRELYQIKYPASGSTELAENIIQHLKAVPVQPDSEMGYDHGAWTVLHHMYPKADIPTLQISIDYNRPGDYHLQLGKALSYLRDEEILVLGSGNIVHNLRAADFYNKDAVPFDWNVEFDELSKKLITERRFSELANYKLLGNSALYSIPTPDHFYPLLYILGLADADENITFPIEGYEHKSISMRAVQIG